MCVTIDDFGKIEGQGLYGLGRHWWSHCNDSAGPLDIPSLIERVEKHDPFAGIIQKRSSCDGLISERASAFQH